MSSPRRALPNLDFQQGGSYTGAASSQAKTTETILNPESICEQCSRTLNRQPPNGRASFTGWVIVVVAGLGDLAAFSVGNASFGVFLRPMSDALGWSRTLLSGAAAMQSLANVVIAPILGPLVDRYDPRVFLGTGSVIACLSYVLMSGVTQPWQFYLLYMSATALGLRQVGGFVTSIVLSKWFIRNRGRALAYSSMGNQIGAIFVVPLVAYLVENLGLADCLGYPWSRHSNNRTAAGADLHAPQAGGYGPAPGR